MAILAKMRFQRPQAGPRARRCIYQGLRSFKFIRKGGLYGKVVGVLGARSETFLMEGP